MLTLANYFMGRDVTHEHELTDAIRRNASETVARANLLVSAYEAATGDTEVRTVNSGWRPPSYNRTVPGAAVRSKHMTGEAIDISDPEGDLDDWCMEHPDILESIGVFIEHPSATKGWCHAQIVPPKSGKRVFWP